MFAEALEQGFDAARAEQSAARSVLAYLGVGGRAAATVSETILRDAERCPKSARLSTDAKPPALRGCAS